MLWSPWHSHIIPKQTITPLSLRQGALNRRLQHRNLPVLLPLLKWRSRSTRHIKHVIREVKRHYQWRVVRSTPGVRHPDFRTVLSTWRSCGFPGFRCRSLHDGNHRRTHRRAGIHSPLSRLFRRQQTDMPPRIRVLLFPFVPIYAMAMVKDAVFLPCFLLFSIQCLEAARTRGASLATPKLGSPSAHWRCWCRLPRKLASTRCHRLYSHDVGRGRAKSAAPIGRNSAGERHRHVSGTARYSVPAVSYCGWWQAGDDCRSVAAVGTVVERAW